MNLSGPRAKRFKFKLKLKFCQSCALMPAHKLGIQHPALLSKSCVDDEDYTFNTYIYIHINLYINIKIDILLEQKKKHER